MNTSQEPDPELGAELRQTAGRDWTEEAAEDERLTELARRRRLDLKEVVQDLAHKGARAAVEFGGHSFSGGVVAAGDDYATLTGSGQTAQVRLERTRWSVLEGGKSEEKLLSPPVSFRGALHELAASEDSVRFALAGGDVVIGTLATVAVDHLEVRDVDGRVTYVPVEMVLGVIRSTDLH